MQTRFWFKVFCNSLLVFLPLVGAVISVLRYGSGSDLLVFFNRIEGNEYPINNILLSAIISGFLVIFIGLIFYFNGVYDDISNYTGQNNNIKNLNKWCFYLLGSVLIIFVIYILFLWISTLQDISQGSKLFNLHNLIFFNKILSVTVFLIFFITDLLIKKSQEFQLQENTLALKNDPTDNVLIKKIEHNKNHIRLSKDATWLINIPTLLLTVSIILFIEQISQRTRFKNCIDQGFHCVEIPNQLSDKLFALFLNGLETGVIASGIIISQVIFIVLKTRWKLRSIQIENS